MEKERVHAHQVEEAEPVSIRQDEGEAPEMPRQLADLVVMVDELRKERKRKRKGRKKKAKKDDASLGTSRGIETMFRSSYRVNMDLSSLADSKANIMISINGIIMSIIIASISPKIDTNAWLLIPTTVLLLGCLGSMVFAVLAARPRVNSNVITLQDVREKDANILFFGNFVHLSRDEYVQGMSELLRDPDRLYHNMIRDIYGLGTVLQRKFRLLRFSYSVFMVGLVLGVILFIGVLAGAATETDPWRVLQP